MSSKIDEQVQSIHQRALKCLEDGQPAKAVKLFRAAIKLSPHNAPLMCNLGYALLKNEQYQEALDWFDFALAAQPGWHIALYNRGLALYNLERFDEAKAAFEEGVKAQPDHVDAKTNLASIHMESLEFDQALDVLDEILAKNPENTGALITKAHVYNLKKQPLRALETINLIDEDAGIDDPTYYIVAASAYFDTGQGFRSYQLLQKAFDIGGLNTTNKMSAAQLLMSLRKSAQCVQLCDEVIAAEPDNYDAYRIKGSALTGMGMIEDAVEASLMCHALAPDYMSNYVSLIFGMNYLDPPKPEIMSRITGDYEKYAAQNMAAVNTYSYGSNRDPDKKLRVGFVSPDLREHSCGYFIESIFAGLDRDKFEVVAIPRKLGKDPRATLLRRLSDSWVPLTSEIWEEVIDTLRSLQLDVAFDLAGHTSNHSIPAFIARVAPVQINWLGYPNTTGIRNMDYRIVDHFTDPVSADRSIYTEELIRMDRCFLCYSPPPDYPPVEDKTGRDKIVFGSFNSISKVNPRVMQLWVQILKRVPGSTLVVKALQFGEESLIEHARQQLIKNGVDPDRLQVFGAMPNTFDHLNLYNEIDIGLDPFPYNGTTTSCEAMLMGIPVVSMCGEVHSARVGLSLMNAVGLGELVAENPEDYIRLAAELALDVPRLRNLQSGMRDRLLSSSLMDRDDFNSHFAASVRSMWRSYCETGKSAGEQRP